MLSSGWDCDTEVTPTQGRLLLQTRLLYFNKPCQSLERSVDVSFMNTGASDEWNKQAFTLKHILSL